MFVALGVLNAVSAGDGWLTDYDKALALSAKTGKPILVDFSGSDWCMWCVKLDEEVFSKKEFKQFAKKNFILLLLDFPRRKQLPEKLKRQNSELYRKYRVPGFPTVLILNSKGEVIARTGYRDGGPRAYIKHLKELLAKKK
jgi:thioredoxin-related protein